MKTPECDNVQYNNTIKHRKTCIFFFSMQVT